jgi:hypothetical protein
MFGEITYTSTDPWSTYTSNERDCHPMLFELRRTMAATSSLFDAVTFELGKQDGHNRNQAAARLFDHSVRIGSYSSRPGVTTKTSSNLPY